MTAGNGAATGHDGGDVADGAETSVGGSDDSVSRKEMAARNIEVAYRAIERGLSSFPVALSYDARRRKIRKRPLTGRGHLDAVRTREELEALFSSTRHRLKKDEVLAAGCVPGSAGFALLDGDVGEGKNGPLFLAETLALGQEFKPFRTPSGGVHIWLRKRDLNVHITNSSPWQDDGVDLRGDNGWAVASGTVSPWGSWEDLEGFDWNNVQEVPEMLWMALVTQALPTRRESGDSWRRYDPAQHAYLLHPATKAFFDYLTSPDRGEMRVDAGTAVLMRSPSGEAYLTLTRPGKGHGVSASLGC